MIDADPIKYIIFGIVYSSIFYCLYNTNLELIGFILLFIAITIISKNNVICIG